MHSKNTYNIDDFLARCLAKPEAHRQLLESLSLMENIGAQKIHRFQRFGFRSAFVLQHAAEEARHAYFFKNAANKFSDNQESSFFDCPTARHIQTAQYLRRLDVAVNREIASYFQVSKRQQFALAYLLVTYVIELRAKFFYEIYESLLREKTFGFSLKSILAEESKHLKDIEKALGREMGSDYRDITRELVEIETRFFQEWMESFDSLLSATPKIGMT